MITPQFIWEQDTGYAACILTDSSTNKTYFGSAVCANVDKDMMSEKTGCQIAHVRATIEALKARREELKAGYKSLRQFYYSVNQSKNYNKQGYMERMLNRQLRMYELDLSVINDEINNHIQMLKEYIDAKDNFYKRIRANRKGDNQ